MPKTSEMFSGDYLKATDLQGRRVEVVVEDCKSIKLGEDDKWILMFKGKDKGLVLNKTNANMIEEITGSDDTDDWAGKAIVLFPAKTDFQGKRVDCIRVDYPKNRQPQPPPEASDSDDTPF